MLEKFNKEFDVRRMNRNSLTLITSKGESVFIHRNAYNKILNNTAVDYRIVEKEFNGMPSQWIEVLTWSAI